MRTFDNKPVSIPPGSISKLFERLEIQSFPQAAMIALTEYVANRSVALLSREGGGLYLGSGVCVRIGNRNLVATAKHNLRDDNGLDLQISDFDVRPRGEKFGEPLEVRSIGMAPNSDLAWLELGRKASKRPRLAFLTIDQIASLQEEKDQQPCFLLGYPKERAEKLTDPNQRPLLEAVGLGTLSIAPDRRQSPRDDNSFAIEWPPHDRSLDGDLPEPHGVSGGGVWLFPPIQEQGVWSPERAKLVGIARAWWREDREEVVTRLERWVELVAKEIPELSTEAKNFLEKMRSKPA